MTVEAAEEHYRALLSSDEGVTARALERASERFTLWGEPLCKVLQPLFVDAATYASAMASASLFYRGLLALLGTPTFARSQPFEGRPRRQPLLERAVARGALLGARVDMLQSSEGFKVLELNPATPSLPPFGVECSDPLAASFAETDVMRALSKKFPNHFVSLHARLFESFVCQHQQRGGTGIPRLAVVHVPTRADAVVDSANERLEQTLGWWVTAFGYLDGRGLGIQLCDLADVTYDGGVLSANGTTIDVVFVEGDPEYLDFCPSDDPIYRAVCDGTVSTACGYPLGNLLDDKCLIADLSSALTTGELDPALAEGLAKVVPWTRRVSDVKTTFGGEPIDLLEFVGENRETLVLKPGLGLGGYGVFLGWEMTQADWLQALATLPAGYVVQQRVTGQKVRMPYLEDGRIETADFFFDLSPFLWADGRAEGCLVRVARSSLLNASQGASLTPMFVVERSPRDR